MADDMETWIKEHAREALTASVSCGLELCSSPPCACVDSIVQFALSAVMRERENKWRPIEEAPKDRPILVCGGTVHYRDDSMYPYEGEYSYVANVCWYDDHWRGGNLEGHDNWIEYRPTLWQPLPAPPRTAETPDGE